jgi:ornithine--oxo-acid transaminase
MDAAFGRCCVEHRECFGIDKCNRVDLAAAIGTGRRVCEALAARGVLAKLTRGSTIRLAPPLVITAGEIRFGIVKLAEALAAMA